MPVFFLYSIVTIQYLPSYKQRTMQNCFSGIAPMKIATQWVQAGNQTDLQFDHFRQWFFACDIHFFLRSVQVLSASGTCFAPTEVERRQCTDLLNSYHIFTYIILHIFRISSTRKLSVVSKKTKALIIPSAICRRDFL